jgi:hypothetical protein
MVVGTRRLTAKGNDEEEENVTFYVVHKREGKRNKKLTFAWLFQKT